MTDKTVTRTSTTSRWDSLREIFVPSLANYRLWIVQFLGGIVIALGAVIFFRTGETWGQLFLGSLLAVVVAVVWLTVDGGTFNYYLDQQRNQPSPLKPALIRAFKHLLPLAILAALFLFLRIKLQRLDDYHYSVPGYLRSEFPAWLRRHVSEGRVQNIYDLFVFFVGWIVLPALFLPFASLCADKGFNGFAASRTWVRMLRNRSFWGVLIVASILGVVAPTAILQWRLDPRTATSTSETIFLVFRMFVGYALVIAAWLMVSFMLARARMKADALPVKPPAAENNAKEK